MYGVTLHINGAERPGGAKILAGATSDAALGVYNRDFQRVGITAVGRHHDYGTRGTVTSAVSALHAIGERYAVFPYPYRMTYLHR